MDDEALEDRVAARQAKKKKKKEGGGDGGENGGADGVVRKKKKKKKKPAEEGGFDGGGDVGSGGGSASRGEGGERRKKKKKKKPAANNNLAQMEHQIEAKARGGVNDSGSYGEGAAVAAATGRAAAEEDFRAKSGYDNNYDEEGGGGDLEMVQKERYHDDSDDVVQLEQEGGLGRNGDEGGQQGDDTETAEAAYCFEADTEVMAEVAQDGFVQVDESGGIQAFVAETIAIDGDAVGIIKSDAEVEKEEKKKYTKYFCGAVAVLVVVIIAVAVPVTLKFAKAAQRTIVTEITEDPTQFPSLMPSDIPSSMPSSVRFTQIVAKLWELSGEQLRVQGSPQYMAAMWMADEDPIPNMKTGGTGLDLDDAGFQQRYVMALFYFAMDGKNWDNAQGWLGEDSECDWFGIQGSSHGCPGGCIKRSDYVGDYDKVCRIAMSSNGNSLYGEIPSEMSILEEMRWFEVQNAYLIGTIPESIGRSWTKMHTMLVGGNFMEGGLPDTFENIQMLGTLFIDRNKFDSTFPNVVTKLRNLEWLDAEENKFVSTLPAAITELKSLRILNLNNNSLTGNLPGGWDENNLIEDFEVEDNRLRGKLPPTLAKARFLKDFRASRNQLSGQIPTEYYLWENLEELYLDQNQMTGELPQGDLPFYDGLQEFSIHSNDFSGRFPVEHFEDTFRVKVLSLHKNPKMTGLISDNICARRDPSLAYTQLVTLTVDCDNFSCDCCTCYINGELVDDGTGS